MNAAEYASLAEANEGQGGGGEFGPGSSDEEEAGAVRSGRVSHDAVLHHCRFAAACSIEPLRCGAVCALQQSPLFGRSQIATSVALCVTPELLLSGRTRGTTSS